MPSEERREITIAELAAMKQRGMALTDVKVSGMIRVIDKDGNVKAELPIERIEDAN